MKNGKITQFLNEIEERAETSPMAFPLQVTVSDGVESATHVIFGLSKREYFAAKAMQAMIGKSAHRAGYVADEAVAYADALIRRLTDKLPNSGAV